MVQNVNPTFVKTPNRGIILISTATGTSTVTVYTGGANGSKINGFNAVLVSTLAATLRFQTTNGSTNIILGTVTIASSAGADGTTASINLFAPNIIGGLPIDSDGNPFLFLASSADTLTANVTATLSGGNLYLTATAGDF